jgi:hypothetical protein
LANKVYVADSAELSTIFQKVTDVCENCNKTIKNFGETAKLATNKLGSFVENYDSTAGEAIKNTCANFIDQTTGTKECVNVQNQLKDYLAQEAVKKKEILQQINQQRVKINESIQSAYKFASYFNFITALFNFGMAIITLKGTCDLIKEHKKVIAEEKAKLEKCSRDLNNYHQQIEEIVKNLKSFNTQNLTISDSMLQSLYDVSDSVRDVQLDLEKIKSKLNIAITEVQSQKTQHISGAYAGGIGAAVCVVATIGQIANIWNVAGIVLSGFGSIAHGIGIRKCKSDINLLQNLNESTEILISNASESMKMIKSAKKELSEYIKKDC